MKGTVLFFFVFSKYFFNLATKHFYGVISIFTVRNEVAKVMFLQASVCPQGGSGVSASVHAGIIPLSPTRSRHRPGADTPRYGHCCGRYASYWNAFLFQTVLNIFKTFSFFLISEGSISWSFGLAILACVLFFLSIIFIVLSRSRESRMRENRKSYKRNTRPMSRPDEELKSGSFYDGASMQGSRPSSVYSIGQHSNRGYAA